MSKYNHDHSSLFAQAYAATSERAKMTIDLAAERALRAELLDQVIGEVFDRLSCTIVELRVFEHDTPHYGQLQTRITGCGL